MSFQPVFVPGGVTCVPQRVRSLGNWTIQVRPLRLWRKRETMQIGWRWWCNSSKHKAPLGWRAIVLSLPPETRIPAGYERTRP